MIGPRVPGESACQWQSSTRVCEHTGHFFGVGANLELRVRAIGPLYVQGRGIFLSNVKPRPDGVHSGIAGFGLGADVYSRLAFVRVEYLFVPTFGPATYRPPFTDTEAGRDVWGRSAGSLSGGVRIPAARRLAVEGWIGLLVGPRSRRTSVAEDAGDHRVIVSFTAGLGLSFDVIAGLP